MEKESIGEHQVRDDGGCSCVHKAKPFKTKLFRNASLKV